MPVTPDVSAIVNGQTIDPADVITPINQLATFANGLETGAATEVTNRTNGDNNLRDGVTALERLVFGAPQSVTLSGGTFTASTKSRYIVDTQGGAATDDLDSISGLAVGQVVILTIASNARVVVVKHNLANGFFNLSGSDITLDNTNKSWMGFWNGSRVLQVGNSSALLQVLEPLWTVPVGVSQLIFPDKTLLASGGGYRVNSDVSLIYRNRFDIRAAAAALVATGIAAPTPSGTLAEANQVDSTYISATCANVIASNSGFVSASFNLLQRRHSPTMEVRMMTGPAASIAAMRFWFGFVSAAPTNVDDLAGGTQGIVFRFSPGASDVGWKGICDDGTSMSLTSDFGTVDADTPYLLRIRVDGSGGGIAYFSVNDGSEVSVNTNIPTAGQNLGVVAYLTTTAAANKAFNFSRMLVTYN